jgi:putative ABC transport system substrate-binding protein
MMNRRAFLGSLGFGVLAAPLATEGQSTLKMPSIGVLVFTSMTRTFQDEFRQGLRDHGYIEGQNVVVEWRAAEGQTDRAKALAAELVRLRVDVIVAVNTPAVEAAANATSTIPIVMASAGDPLGTGLVASFARPGGNITGMSSMAAELSAKRIELLRELIPGLTRVAVLIHGGNSFTKPFVDETQAATKRAGLQLQVLDVRQPQDVEAAFSAIAKERAGAVLIPTGLAAAAWRTAELALRQRIPSVSFQRQFVESGGLMSFGANVADMHRRAARFVDRIFKGAKPGDLPVEQPTTFELVINLKTAKALGLIVPRSLLARADHVIE